MEINLLPWREAQYKKRKKNIWVEVSIGLLLIFLFLFLKNRYDAVIFESQERKTHYLESYLKKTEKNYVHAVLEHKEEMEAERQRVFLKNKISSSHLVLQAIYDFSNAMPDEMYLTEITKKEESLYFFGKTQSHEMLMQFLETVKKRYAQRITIAEIAQETGQGNGVHFEIQVAV